MEDSDYKQKLTLALIKYVAEVLASAKDTRSIELKWNTGIIDVFKKNFCEVANKYGRDKIAGETLDQLAMFGVLPGLLHKLIAIVQDRNEESRYVFRKLVDNFVAANKELCPATTFSEDVNKEIDRFLEEFGMWFDKLVKKFQ